MTPEQAAAIWDTAGPGDDDYDYWWRREQLAEDGVIEWPQPVVRGGLGRHLAALEAT